MLSCKLDKLESQKSPETPRKRERGGSFFTKECPKKKRRKGENMEIRRMKLTDLRPADYNPRITLKEGDPEYEALKKSIEEDGLVVPIVWNEETGNVVSGHQRLNLLLATGETEAEVSVVHFDETRERQANIALNRIEGEWDEERLRDLFAELDTEDIFSTGFTEAELRTIYPEGLEDGPVFTDEDTDDEHEDGEDDEDTENAGGEFTVFLSFPSKDKAETWVRGEGREPDFSAGRTMIIRMDEEDEDNEDA